MGQGRNIEMLARWMERTFDSFWDIGLPEHIQKSTVQFASWICRLHKDNCQLGSLGDLHPDTSRTIARWKSGLSLVVFANNVNCETHKISPSISFTLAFHIFFGSVGSEKTRRPKLGKFKSLKM